MSMSHNGPGRSSPLRWEDRATFRQPTDRFLDVGPAICRSRHQPCFKTAYGEVCLSAADLGSHYL